MLAPALSLEPGERALWASTSSGVSGHSQWGWSFGLFFAVSALGGGSVLSFTIERLMSRGDMSGLAGVVSMIRWRAS